MNISSGYGYGIWLLVHSPYFSKEVKHIPHITLICNLSLSHATELYNSIEEHFNYNIPSFTMNITEQNRSGTMFPTGEYSSDPNYLTQYSWGYYCDTDDHQLTMTNQLIRDFFIDNDFIGSIPSKLHLTMQYNQDIKNIINIHRCPSHHLSMRCSLKLVDISSGDPSKWILLN